MKQTWQVEAILDRMRAAAGVSSSVPDSKQFSDLRNQIALAGQARGQVGQINPRNPGALNDAIQFGKKIMRRVLAWYLRPLDVFQGALIGALQHTADILEDHRDQLYHLSESRAGGNDSNRNNLLVAQQIHSQVQAHIETLLEARHDASTGGDRAAQFEQRFSILEERVGQTIEHSLEDAKQSATELRTQYDEKIDQLSSRIDLLAEALRALQGNLNKLG